ncbi:hypothetical protein [Campylobacter sp. CCUG 57310]|uniref:hypothetical protein n=1 Tax=Campylobacter sp. CCUG 57310 TaxID=2517362 RepID=UPI0015635EC0|nr:hypothetical protein [Campylobacter sp. CCUG 57310]QKF93208.1 hypothetical protein CORI_a022 [Campylobacter sp. CCUG 57310]
MKKVGLISILVAVCVFANPLDEIAGKIGNTSEAITDGINKGKDVIDGIVGGATDKLDGLLGGKIRGINGNIDKLDKIVDQVQNSPFGKCYFIPEPNLDFCSLIPDMEASFDVCSILPNLPGLKKKSYGISQDESPLRELCRQREKNGGKDSGFGGITQHDIGIYGSGASNKKTSKKPSYDAPGGKGGFEKMLEKGTLANTALLQFDQEKIKLIKNIGENKSKEIEDVTIEDIVSTMAKDIDEYNQERNNRVTELTAVSIDNSPYRFNQSISAKLRKSPLSSFQSIRDNEVRNIHKLLDAEQQKVLNFELSRAFNKDFIATPTREYIDILRQDIKVDTVNRINKQIREEVKIMKDIGLEYEKKKDIISLTAEKAVIMNIKFDRNLAKAEVEALIR